MTPQQISLVQSSWSAVAPIATTAADLFYARLFTIDPTLRPMFPANLAEQKKKLMQMLGRVVSALYDLDSVLADVRELGKRHTGYGVKPDHYATVGAALIDTLRTGLGERFTRETEAAWVTAYELLAGVMLEGARAEAA